MLQTCLYFVPEDHIYGHILGYYFDFAAPTYGCIYMWKVQNLLNTLIHVLSVDVRPVYTESEFPCEPSFIQNVVIHGELCFTGLPGLPDQPAWLARAGSLAWPTRSICLPDQPGWLAGSPACLAYPIDRPAWSPWLAGSGWLTSLPGLPDRPSFLINLAGWLTGLPSLPDQPAWLAHRPWPIRSTWLAGSDTDIFWWSVTTHMKAQLSKTEAYNTQSYFDSAPQASNTRAQLVCPI
jgi:hypothetical protein